MRKLIPIILMVLLIQGCAIKRHLKNTSIENEEKVLLKKEGNAVFFYWELKDNEALWKPELGRIDALQAYRDSLKLKLGNTKYKAAVHKESIQNLDSSALSKAKNGDEVNATLVHTGKIGKVRTINYIEAQILNHQLSRYPLMSKPTEFHGFLAQNDSTKTIRIYFGASDTEWPPRPTVILNALDKALKNGWKLTGHLHNHYCKEDKDYVGILAPSLADAQYYKMLKETYNIDKTFITNGFHTVEMANKDFEKFESH